MPNRKPQTMPQIPKQIVADILARLPVKSLLRLRCVSKPWCSQIDSPAFIKLHHNHSSQTTFHGSLILVHPLRHTVHSMRLDSLHQVFPLESPPATRNRLIGSCNGLLCIYKSVTEIFIWNPSTRKHLKLPPMPITSSRNFDPSSYSFNSMAYAFGYDALRDDYRLLTIDEYTNNCVYSLKSNLWKRNLACPFPVAREMPVGVFVSGAFHWMTSSASVEGKNKCAIVRFDLGDEHCFPSVLELPVDRARERQVLGFTLGVLNGSLSTACHDLPIYGARDRIDVWVMKEYGVVESWALLFSTSGFVVVRPLAYTNGENEVILEGGRCKLLRYDLKKKRMESVHVAGRGWPSTLEAESVVGNNFGAQAFVGSLVNPLTLAGVKARNNGNANKRDGFLSKGVELVS